MKRIISKIICLCMVCGILSGFEPISAAVAATPTEGTAISTVDEFLSMDPNGVYYLANDIDFGGRSFNQKAYSQAFKGVLDGNGHALLGIVVTGSNSDAGFFANSFGGTLKNITIGSIDEPARISSTGAAYSVAVVAGTMVSGANFDNVTIFAEASGDGKTAGFTSYIPNGKITINNCRVYGSVKGNPAAGFVTMSHDGQGEIVITNSVNYASVVGGNLGAGGFYCTHSMDTSTRLSTMSIIGCANHGDITADDWRVGGIVGEFNETANSVLVIDYCYNTGTITMNGAGGRAAGIVGGLCFGTPNEKRSVSNVYNVGIVQNTANSENAYALCYAENAGETVTMKNAAYITGTSSVNVEESNVSSVTEKKLLDTVKGYGKSADNVLFVADSVGINKGYPVLNFESTVHENVETYDCGRKVCTDCNVVLTSAEQEHHSFVETEVEPSGYFDGTIICECSGCHIIEIKPGKPSEYQVVPTGDVYSINSADGLMWYATNLNAGTLTGKEALVLSADIDMSGKKYEPIGNGEKAFFGSFDGGFYTISNLQVESDKNGGLFGRVGMGTTISNLALKNVTVNATDNAGALVGEVSGSAVVKIKNIVLSNTNVTSVEGGAGSLIGSTANANSVECSTVISENAKVNGAMAGGLLGNGTNAVLKNSFVSARVTASQNMRGLLAYYSDKFTQRNCGYVLNHLAEKTDGTEMLEESFANGEIAYLLNTLGANRIFGVKDGAVVFSDTPMYMIRQGSTKIYTDKLLTAQDAVSLYAAEDGDGVVLAIVIDRSSGVKLMDHEIKISDGGKTTAVKFADMELARFVEANGNYYAAESGVTLYTIALDGVSASATYSVGDLFNSSAKILK